MSPVVVPSPRGAPRRGLEHVGVLYDTPESLVETVGPRVSDALAAGEDVYLGVDRRTARGFREWLGPRGERVAYPSPAGWLRDPARELRSVVRPDRRTLVLGQYRATGVDGEQARNEDGINLVLSDLPLTVLCSCAADAAPDVLTALHGGHPHLVVDGTTTPNPDYRPPATHSPVAGALWGPATVRLEFRAPDDLHRLREHVARAATAMGMHHDTVHEAVLATHEAALLAAGGADPLGPALGTTVPCTLEVRAESGMLYCEVTGPRAPLRAAGAWPPATADPLHIVRLFCDHALLHDQPDLRSVRVLRAA